MPIDTVLITNYIYQKPIKKRHTVAQVHQTQRHHVTQQKRSGYSDSSSAAISFSSAFNFSLASLGNQSSMKLSNAQSTFANSYIISHP